MVRTATQRYMYEEHTMSPVSNPHDPKLLLPEKVTERTAEGWPQARRRSR